MQEDTLFEKKKKPTGEKVTSSQIKEMLARKYPGGGVAPQYAFFTEVRNGTGSDFGRSADGFAMCMWPSQGHEISGFEIKVDRGDWLNELKQPQKSQAVMQYCDRWYVVASPGVVDPREVPKNWGFIEAKGGKLFTKIKAPLLEAVPLTRTFVSALLRKATENVVSVEVYRSELGAQYDKGVKDTEKKAAEAEKKLADHREMVRVFEENAGIKVIDNWEGIEKAKKVGTLVRFILDGGIRSMKWDVDHALERAEEAVKELKKVKEFSEACKDIST